VKRGKEESKESREREWVEDRLEKVKLLCAQRIFFFRNMPKIKIGN
jgi:hypothetical protein